MAHRPRWTLSQVTELFENRCWICCLKRSRCIVSISILVRCRSALCCRFKTGACPEDCKYCPQSSRYKTGLEAERLMEVEQVLESARKGESGGIDAFLYGRGVEESPRTRYAVHGTNGAG